MRKFALFYEDGSIVEGGGEDDNEVTLTFVASRKWLEAPNDGVQLVVYEQDGKHAYWHGVDHYMLLPDGDEIYATNDLGPYIRKHLKGMVKYGLCIGKAEYEAYVQKVKDYQWNNIFQKIIKPDRRKQGRAR